MSTDTGEERSWSQWAWETASPWEWYDYAQDQAAQATSAAIATGVSASVQAAQAAQVVHEQVQAAQQAAQVVHEQVQAAQEHVTAYMTTATDNTPRVLHNAAAHQLARAAQGQGLAGLRAIDPGVMSRQATTGQEALYRLAYWSAVAARVYTYTGDQAEREEWMDISREMLDRADRLSSTARDVVAIATQGWVAPPKRMQAAGWATFATRRKAASGKYPSIREIGSILATANAAALQAFYVRAGLITAGVGVAAVGVAYAAKAARGRPRRNGWRKFAPRSILSTKGLNQAEKDRRMRGLALALAGGVLMSPADEVVVAALTVGLGIPVLPVQGAATFAGGAIMTATGLYLAATPKG